MDGLFASLPRSFRFVLTALMGMLLLSALMLAALIPAAHAEGRIPVEGFATFEPVKVLLVYAALAIVAAGVASWLAWRLRPDRIIAVAAAGIVLLAFAQGSFAADGSTLVDVTPIAETGFWMVNAVLVPVLGWIGTLLFKKLKLDRIIADKAMNSMLHEGLQRSVDVFEGLIRDQIFKDGKPLTVDVHSEAVAAVANRMVELSPDLLKRLGITEERLQQLAAETIATRTPLPITGRAIAA